MEDLDTLGGQLSSLSPFLILSRITPVRIGTPHGLLCVVDWCVETTAVSPEITVSFKRQTKYVTFRTKDEYDIVIH